MSRDLEGSRNECFGQFFTSLSPQPYVFFLLSHTVDNAQAQNAKQGQSAVSPLFPLCFDGESDKQTCPNIGVWRCGVDNTIEYRLFSTISYARRLPFQFLCSSLLSFGAIGTFVTFGAIKHISIGHCPFPKHLAPKPGVMD